MSDLLALYNRIQTRGEIDIPRYYDLINSQQTQKEEETPEQVIKRFDRLRRT